MTEEKEIGYGREHEGRGCLIFPSPKIDLREKQWQDHFPLLIETD